MIDNVSIENFKSIKEIKQLTLKPLTIFTGVNSSGKSNIMEAISLFGQVSRLQKQSSSRSTVQFERIFLQGDQKRYARPIEDYIMYKKDPRNTLTIEINLKINQDLEKRIGSISSEHVEAKKYLFEDNVPIETIGYSYSVKISDQIIVQKVLINMIPIFVVKAALSENKTIVIPEDFNQFQTRASTRIIFDENVFRSNQTHPVLDVVSNVACEITNIIKEQTSRMFLISGERGKILPEQKIRERPEFIPTWIGYNSENIIEVLSHCMVRETDKFEQIKSWASKFQLMNLTAGRTLTNTLESHFMDNTFKLSLNSSLSGLGSRQLLSLITQIFWSESGDVIMIEEPEISLHPENQVILQQLFSEAVSQNKQIICSTHSPFFVLALSKAIKKKLINIDDIAIYQVEKNVRGTELINLKLNKFGFIEDGVPSFMKVESDLYKEWMNSLEKENDED